MTERWERTADALSLWAARRMPKRLRKWAVIAAHADATTGDNSSKHPDEVKAFDLYR